MAEPQFRFSTGVDGTRVTYAISATVRDLARTSAAVSFDDRGPHALKGIADPLHLFAVRAEPR